MEHPHHVNVATNYGVNNTIVDILKLQIKILLKQILSVLVNNSMWYYFLSFKMHAYLRFMLRF